jgi:cell division transport system permease protein
MQPFRQQDIRPTADLLPPHSIAGRTLIVTLAIMAFLSMLALASADLLMQTAERWQGTVSSDITLQMKVAEGRNIEKDLIDARDLLKNTPGIVGVSVYSKLESARLLEPWLGAGAMSEDLPIPRLIAIKLGVNPPDFTILRAKIRTLFPNASLEDHKPVQSRLKSMAYSLVMLAFAVVIMTLATGVLTVVFATRAAVAVNGAVVEVLHFVGAEDKYIARQFERRFLMLGFKGAVIGVFLASLTFILLGIGVGFNKSTAVSDQMIALFGEFNVGLVSLCGGVALILLLSLLTSLTSRMTVMQALRAIE